MTIFLHTYTMVTMIERLPTIIGVMISKSLQEMHQLDTHCLNYASSKFEPKFWNFLHHETHFYLNFKIVF